jgi:hypothetical protein
LIGHIGHILCYHTLRADDNSLPSMCIIGSLEDRRSGSDSKGIDPSESAERTAKVSIDLFSPLEFNGGDYY